MTSSVTKIQSESLDYSLVLDTSKDPWLLDHQFQSLCIAPGAALVASVLRARGSLSDINFVHMIPLSEYVAVTVNAYAVEQQISFGSVDGVTKYASCESTAREESPVPLNTLANAISSNAREVDGADVYSKLKQLGNHYGPAFQTIQSIKYADDGSMVEASWASPPSSSDFQRLTVLLDSLTHILSNLGAVDTAYYLTHIGKVSLYSQNPIPEFVTIRSTGVSGESSSLSASFELFDSENRLIIAVESISIAVDSHIEKDETVAVASTFTIDPLIDVFDFWKRRYGFNVQPAIADYGQLFQALLSPDSVLSGNSQSNVLLVRLEDLAHDRGNGKPVVNTNYPATADTRELPDGRVVAQLNKYETDYLYQEIFVDLAYRRHNVCVLDGDTVIDIGANIGFFSLFATSEANNVSIIAIEPSPVVLPILKANLAAYAPGAIVIEGGASSEIGEAEFTAYRKSSVFSSFSADSVEDREAIAQVVRNTLLAGGHTDEKLIGEAVDELMADRMESEQFNCKLISVSDVIDQHAIKKIDLLKIDAEKSEEAIIEGIRDEHWPLIQQIIIEVHLQSGSDVNFVLDKLKAEGFVCVEDEEELLEDSGLVTVYAARPERFARNTLEAKGSGLHQSAALLIDAVEQYVGRTGNNVDLVLCPSNTRDPQLTSDLQLATDQIQSQFEANDKVSASSSDNYSKNYSALQIFDPVSDVQGHIPYTKEWFAGIGTSMLRKQLSKTRTPYKVLILDCDNTLWNGVVGEVGAGGVKFDETHLDLMRFAVECKNRGMLLCLASKNDEASVKEVFDQRAAEMPLGWGDIVTAKANWDRKSENLKQLARELNVGLDSFIFVDDSPIECAEVQLGCPGVLVVQLPELDKWKPDFLRHIWAFDQGNQTEEDSKRSDMYQVEQGRRKHQSTSNSLADFIAGLDLEVQIEPMDEESLERAAQMTMRTNQFNLSTVRRNSKDLLTLEDQGFSCDIVTVSDRFGDYGITGLVIYKSDENSLSVDTFLLSCRVLGRGVEYEIASYLSDKAQSQSLGALTFNYAATAKNEPARKFLESLPGVTSLQSENCDITIDAKAEIKADFSQTPVIDDSAGDTPVETAHTTDQKNVSVHRDQAKRYVSIAELHFSVEVIARDVAIRQKMERPELDNQYVAPANTTEQKIAIVWCDLLGIEKIGVNDNFFELGGTSLQGVELVSLLQKQLGTAISIVHVFEKPTIAGLASLTDDDSEGDDKSVASGKARGSARREARSRRSASRK